MAVASDSGLVFAWDKTGRRRLALAGFIAGSFVLHALCFYAFQIIYPPTIALLPPPGRVTVIGPNTEEGRSLLRWIEAEDPALASTTQLPPDTKSLALPTIQHAPSYLMRIPPLRGTLPSLPDMGIPSSRPPAPIESLDPLPQTVTQQVPTTVRLSDGLESLGSLQIPKMEFETSRRESPGIAEFRIAVDEKGAIRYCFLERSSGDVSLDEQARKYLSLSRFAPTDNRPPRVANDLIWGTAMIEWGNEIVISSSPTGNITP
jgi:hypothetical protein